MMKKKLRTEDYNKIITYLLANPYEGRFFGI